MYKVLKITLINGNPFCHCEEAKRPKQSQNRRLFRKPYGLLAMTVRVLKNLKKEQF